MGILIILIVVAIIALLLFLPITIEYAVSYDGNFKSRFLIRFFGIKNDLSNKKREKKPKKEKKKKKISEIIEDIKYYKKLFKTFKSDISMILKYAKDKGIKIKQASIDIAFAGKDAMQTGIFTGIVNATSYNMVSVVDRTVGIEDWSVNVQPDFHKDAFVDAKIHCILNTKFAHIIVVLMRFLKLYLKHKNIRKNTK